MTSSDHTNTAWQPTKHRKLMGGSFASAALRLMLAASALTAFSSPDAVVAQIQWGGELDIAYAHDVVQDEGEPRSQINTSFGGKSPFSLIRLRLQADAPIAEGIHAFTIVRYDEGQGEAEVEGAYAVFSSVLGRPQVNVLVGKMATVFGTFANRSHATKNPVIGVPLIYHYFSALQSRRVPLDAVEQLGYRNAAPASGRGLPILYDACWNTGIQVFGAPGRLAYAIALTKGTVSSPGAWTNAGAQLVARLGYRPTMAWAVGTSVAVGPYLYEVAADSPSFPVGESVEGYYQVISGVDARYILGHWEFAAELVRASWEVPNLSDSLVLLGGYLEGSWAVCPGYRLAARFGQIDYGRIADGAGGKEDWDYDVRRLETAIEYYLSRNARLKLAAQLNFRSDAPDDQDHLLGVQLATSF